MDEGAGGGRTIPAQSLAASEIAIPTEPDSVRVAVDAKLAQLFREMDTNANGTLDREEVSRLLVRLRTQAIGGEDTDDNSWITPSDDEVDAAMRSMDANGDGTVTLSEFAVFFERKGGLEYAEDPGMWGRTHTSNPITM